MHGYLDKYTLLHVHTHTSYLSINKYFCNITIARQLTYTYYIYCLTEMGMFTLEH